MSFYDNNQDFINFNKALSESCEVVSSKISINISPKNPNIISNLVTKFSKHSSIKKMSISSDIVDIDLIKNIFTKHVDINLAKDHKDDLIYIEETLKFELLKII